MLKKILHIKNIGLFQNATWTSSEFCKATLIYAENGRGKSTLASIFRSCSTSDTASISLRQTLDSNEASEIKLLFNNGKLQSQAIFSGGKWSDSYPDISVFDTEFVDRNIYSGISVSPNHRQELLEFALGEDAVKLKQQVDSESQKASESSRELSSAERTLAGYRKNMTLKEFSCLPSDLNIDEHISSIQKRLISARENEFLQSDQCPRKITEPLLDLDEFFEILSTTLEDIEKTAEETVRSHIAKYPNKNFETWLSQGQSFGDVESCPYCSQSIINIDLVKSYKAHFNQAYTDLRAKVVNISKNIERQLSDTVIEQLVCAVANNQSIAGDWAKHVHQQEFYFNTDDVKSIFDKIRSLFFRLAQDKQQNLLESIGTDIEKKQAKDLWDQVLIAVRTCNQAIDTSINNITAFKNDLDGEDVENLKQEIEKLELIKIRYSPDVCDLIQQWNDAKTAKQQHEQQKISLREQLDTLMAQTLEQYQSKINGLIKKFGALFEISALRPDYVGTGLPRSNYGLKVKGQGVKLIAEGAPSFSNALSEGDKRTLAFAFFIARIEADPNLSNKIVVVDDPVCSLDQNRRNQTKRILRDISLKSAQLIVLGHDSYFLRDLRDDLQESHVEIQTQLLKITRINGDYSDFSRFDIDVACASDYYRNHKTLHDFVNGIPVQDSQAVARAIRPLLEGYLHRRFPGHVQRNKLFGQIIGDAKVAQPPNPLVHLQPLTNELYEINEYAGQFHHDTSASADTQIVETELRTYAERALALIYRGTPLA
jgi:wobble nucleotide-excising tRNase